MATFRNIVASSSGNNGTVVWPPSGSLLTFPGSLDVVNIFADGVQASTVDITAGGVLSFDGGGGLLQLTFTGSARSIVYPDKDGTIALLSDITDTAYAEKTANYTITNNDGTINVTANSVTITLPTAVGITGQIFTIKNTGAGTVSIATTSSQTIDGGAAPTLATGDVLTVQSTNANWIII